MNTERNNFAIGFNALTPRAQHCREAGRDPLVEKPMTFVVGAGTSRADCPLIIGHVGTRLALKLLWQSIARR